MLEIKGFSLEKHEGPYENWPEISKLFKDGEYTNHKIPGYYIERQFQFDEYYFLVTSYDCPFEEQCDFILLNKDYKLIAKKSLIPWNYSSWNLDGHEYLGNNQFIFTFNKDYKLKVKLNPNKTGLFSKRIVINYCKIILDLSVNKKSKSKPDLPGLVLTFYSLTRLLWNSCPSPR